MKSMNEQWSNFNSSVIPPDAGKYQRRDMKVAFYAGASSLFSGLMEKIDSKCPQEECSAYFESIEKEIIKFMDEVLCDSDSN